MTHLHRRQPERNMARFYAMTIERSLFGQFLLVRCWGRIGARGQTKSEWFEDEVSASRRRDQLAQQKRRRGYGEPQGAHCWSQENTADGKSNNRPRHLWARHNCLRAHSHRVIQGEFGGLDDEATEEGGRNCKT